MVKIFKTAASLVFIIVLNFICQQAVKALHINFPASLIAMILLSGLMFFKIIPLSFIENGAKLLLDHIGLFFVSLIVGAFGYLLVIKDKLPVILAIFVITSVLLIVFTGILTQYLLAKRICKKRIIQNN